ncbi:MAG: DegT/DnrJ/EryC1/StrS family aminotransferase [Bacteroidota bacterium]
MAEVKSKVDKVPFFDYKYILGQYREELTDIMMDISSRGAFILQDELRQFEKNLADFLGAKHSLGVGNCTDGLLLAMRAAGIGKDDEVIFSSHTFVATASAIYHNGAKPIPVECGKDHLIDPKAIEAAITSRTKAIVPTQLNGQVCDMDAIIDICKRNNLILIEDAAQSLGAKYKGKSAGTFGLASAYSYYPAKVVGCFGDGGSVVTNDDTIYEQVFLTRDHGRAKIGEVVTWGLNSRLDNLQAAILDFKLKKYPLDIERRRQIASLYQQYLEDVTEITLPLAPGANNDKYEVFQNYEVEVDANVREDLRAYLSQKGIGTILQWGGKAVHEFEGLGLKYSLPFTESLMRRAFLLPMNTSLSNDEVIYVAEHLRSYFGYGK